MLPNEIYGEEVHTKTRVDAIEVKLIRSKVNSLKLS